MRLAATAITRTSNRGLCSLLSSSLWLCSQHHFVFGSDGESEDESPPVFVVVVVIVVAVLHSIILLRARVCTCNECDELAFFSRAAIERSKHVTPLHTKMSAQ